MRAHVEGLLREALASHPNDTEAQVNHFFGLYDCADSWLIRSLRLRVQAAEAEQGWCFALGAFCAAVVALTVSLL